MPNPSRKPPAALIAWTWLTLGGLAYALMSYLFCWLTEPPSFPGDPNIGAGLVCIAAVLNVPTLFFWMASWGMAEVERERDESPRRISN